MTDNKPNYDSLKCGNCGFDGGVAHANEKLEWEQRIHKAELRAGDTESTRMTRSWAKALGWVIVVLTLSVAGYNAVEVVAAPSPDPAVEATNAASRIAVSAHEHLQEMYQHCLNYGAGTDTRAAITKSCNDTFGDQIRKMDEQVSPPPSAP